MTGMAIEWPMIDCRLHVCATAACPSRHTGSRRGLRGPCEHVRFIGWVPTEEAATWDAVSSGGASTGGALVVPSSAMGAGPSDVPPSPTVATEVPSAVAEVACEGLHVAASAAEEATPAVAEPGSANAGETGVEGNHVAAAMATFHF